jgi:hypothetical protein
MFDPFELAREFFEGLTTIDEAIVAQAARKPCRDCDGPLHRGDYPRKPRGGHLGAFAEQFGRRFSLCCGREGCRHRATPPSVRYLGRRVYVGAIVIVVSALAVVAVTASEVVRASGVPARTTRRWRRWWRGAFTTSTPFVELSARLVPAPSRERLPLSMLERLPGDRSAKVTHLLTWLAPLTTMTCPEASRFARGVT